MQSVQLHQDFHIHTLFSRGNRSVSEVVTEAEERGLSRVAIVDSAGPGTSWVSQLVSAVRAARRESSLKILCGVEAAIANAKGELDLPLGIHGLDLLLAVCDRWPAPDGAYPVEQVRSWLEQGSASPDKLLEFLVDAMVAASQRYPGLVLARPFSILPAVGLSEDCLSDSQVDRLAQTAAACGVWIEVNERCRCPSLRVLRACESRGVTIVPGSDSRQGEEIGRYDFVSRRIAELALPAWEPAFASA